MAGRHRHLLTLETRTDAVDSLGDAATTYSTAATAWGSLEAVSARERLESQQVNADVSHRAIVRYTAAAQALTAKDRVTLGSRVFDLVAPPLDRDGRRRELELILLERA